MNLFKWQTLCSIHAEQGDPTQRLTKKNGQPFYFEGSVDGNPNFVVLNRALVYINRRILEENRNDGQVLIKRCNNVLENARVGRMEKNKLEARLKSK